MSIAFRRRSFIGRVARWLAIAGLAASGLAHAQAQSWPNKPVRLVVPVGAGGTTDILAREIAKALHASTGQPFVVDLKPGAAGAVGSMDVMTKAPDGYTLLVGTASTHGVSIATQPNLGYSLADFTLIGLLADTNTVLLVSPKLGVKSVRELIELAKAKPGFLNYMSTGNGSFTHLMSAMLGLQANVRLAHVPYKGFAQVVPDMMGGAMHIAWDSVPSALPFVKDGRLVGLAVSGSRRSAALGDLPTIGEAMRQLGLQPFAASAWFGLFGPKGMAPDLVRRINEELNKVLRSPEVMNRFAALGIEADPGTPAQFTTLVTGDIERWRRVVKDAGIKVE